MYAEQSQIEPDVWGLFNLHSLAAKGLDNYLDASLKRCVDWFHARAASLFLAETPSGEFQLRARAGKHKNLQDDAVIKTGEGIAGVAVLERRPLIVGDPRESKKFKKAGIDRRHEIGSSMVIPLVEPNGVCFGVLNIARGNQDAPFREPDLEQAAAVAAHVTLAISNARLIDRLSRTLKTAQDARDKLRAVLDGVPIAVLVMEGDGQVTDRNAAATTLFGFGYCVDDLLDQLESRELAEDVRSVLSERGPAHRRSYDPTTDRTWLVAETPLRDEGAVITVQELTDYERAQQESQRLQRLAEIGQMTAQIAHEIRNPLTGIAGAAQMVSGNPDMAEEIAGIISDEVCKLDSLCNDFLEFARPLHVTRRSADLADIVKKAERTLLPAFKTMAVELEVEINDTEILELDPRRIEQVLLNLARNAAEACESGGKVKIVVEEATLIIEDNGAGMDEATRERLFTAFFTTKAQGTGLGLVNVRKILDAHGATIRVFSKLGQGSRFEIKFEERMR